jgi:hypothetical protein
MEIGISGRKWIETGEVVVEAQLMRGCVFVEWYDICRRTVLNGQSLWANQSPHEFISQVRSFAYVIVFYIQQLEEAIL